MSVLLRSLKEVAAGLARRMDRANAARQRWMMSLPVDAADTQSQERS